MTNWEENWEDNRLLDSLKKTLKRLENECDSYTGDRESEEYENLVWKTVEMGREIEELTQQLKIN